MQTQITRWKMVEDYLMAINQCIENAYDDHDKEQVEKLKNDKKEWLKRNFTIGRPNMKHRRVNIFDK